MRFSKSFGFIAVLIAVSAGAANVDFDDPRRVLGREDGVRIDAQLTQQTLFSGSAINVTYQIQNLSDHDVAVADRITEVSFDADTGIITVAIGSEILPVEGPLPKLMVIPPGEKKTFRCGSIVAIAIPAIRSPFMSTPRSVQIKISVLRDVAPFRDLIARPSQVQKVDDELFDRWIDGNDTIFLNVLPIQWQHGGSTMPTAESRDSRRRGGF